MDDKQIIEWVKKTSYELGSFSETTFTVLNRFARSLLAEQREEDAKICDRLARGNVVGGELSAGQIIAAVTLAAAIRGKP